MGLLNDSQSRKKNYPFVDFIRFFSIMGIVWAHSDIFPEKLILIEHFRDHAFAYIAFKQVFKFSVISFFIISGFLMGEQLKSLPPLVYFMNRVRSILGPYLIALTIFMLLVAIFVRPFGDPTILDNLNNFFYLIFSTPYWYIPVYFLTFIFLLPFHKYFNKIWFGGILLLITAYYTYTTVHLGKNHTTSPFGFVFYVWFGTFIYNYDLIKKIRQIKWPLLIGLIVISFLLACYQSYALVLKHSPFFSNNLRVFNQVYGVLVFCFLIKICPENPSYWRLKPRQETFGIYLYHIYPFTFLFKPLVEWTYQEGWYPVDNFVLVMLIFVVQFVIGYLSTTFFVKWIRHSKIPIL